MLRRRTDEEWTDKHRNVMRKLVVEGVWVQKRLHDIGLSDENKRGDHKEEGSVKHRLVIPYKVDFQRFGRKHRCDRFPKFLLPQDVLGTFRQDTEPNRRIQTLVS